MKHQFTTMLYFLESTLFFARTGERFGKRALAIN